MWLNLKSKQTVEIRFERDGESEIRVRDVKKLYESSLKNKLYKPDPKATYKCSQV